MAEKTNIEKFFDDLSSGTTWNVGVSIARKNPFPLDNTSVFKSQSDLTTYTQNGMAYMGQPVAVINDDGSVNFYVLDADKQPQEVGKATTGDDNSIVLDNGVLKLLGIDSAAVGAQLTKGADGKISWVVPSTDTVDGLQTTVESLRDIVNGKAAVGEEGSEDYQPPVDGLVQKVAKNTTDIATNTAAIATLNAGATVEGSVAYQIAQIVENSDNDSIDTLKEIAAWIEEHPESVAEINKDIKANSDAIDALELLVGDTAVATQISNAIDTALKVDGLNKYALASELTTLAGRVNTAEGKITTIETSIANNPLHTHTNKTELDNIVEGDVTKWNTAATDVSTLKTKEATNPLHTHTQGVEVLNLVTSEKINSWDSAETNAKTHTENYAATKAQGALADTAVQSLTVLGHTLDKNTKTTLTVEEAKTALGLGSAAYADTTAFDASGSAAAVRGDTTETVKSAYELAASKITGAEVDTKIANAGHALASDLTVHTGDDKIHVTEELKNKWNAAADLVDNITGGQVGGITNTINEAIKTHREESETRYDAKYETITNVNAIKARVTDVETKAGNNETALATLNSTVTGEGGHGERIATAESKISTLETDSKTHAIKTEVESALALKADKSAYDKTAETVAELKATVDAFFSEDAAVDETIDTLKEIVTYIQGDESGATDMVARIGALETKVGDENSGLVKKTNDNITAINAEVTRATDAESALATRIKDLEDNKAGYATLTQVTEAKEAAISTAATDATTKVNALRDGAVATNTSNIATNTASITSLTTTKANVADVYAKTETYSKTEVDGLLSAAEITWGTF